MDTTTETIYGKTGHVTISVIDNRDGQECWIHDLEGEGMDAVEMMVKARSKAKEWGFTEVWANVTNPRLAIALKNHGWNLEQLILKGRT